MTKEEILIGGGILAAIAGAVGLCYYVGDKAVDLDEIKSKREVDQALQKANEIYKTMNLTNANVSAETEEKVKDVASRSNFAQIDIMNKVLQTGFLLILDEIASGFYRTGPRFAMMHTATQDCADFIKPDIMCIGKALTGGSITMAACVASEKVADTITNSKIPAFMHGPTYMANPLACAAGIASLSLFESRDYASSVARIEKRLKANLEPLRSLENVADVRVLGAIGVLELKAKPSADDILRVIRETGVWLRPFCNYVYTMPPFITSDAEVDRICEAIKMIGECEPAPIVDGEDEFHE